jgi:hypothetical protein
MQQQHQQQCTLSLFVANSQTSEHLKFQIFFERKEENGSAPWILYVSDMYLSLSLSFFLSFNFIISLDGGCHPLYAVPACVHITYCC